MTVLFSYLFVKSEIEKKHICIWPLRETSQCNVVKKYFEYQYKLLLNWYSDLGPRFKHPFYEHGQVGHIRVLYPFAIVYR